MRISVWFGAGLVAAMLTTAGTAEAQPSLQLAAGPAADSLETVNQGDLRYRWRRGNLRVDLRNRGAQWTLTEARWMRDLLDDLPNVYLRKAIEGGMRTVYRDRTPYAPWNALVGPKDVAGVAVPPGPWRYVALGNRAFERGQGAFNRVMVHEVGHCVQWKLSGWSTLTRGTNGFTGISWTTGVPAVGMRSWNGFPSDYARTTHMEDFAEACEFYWFDPAALREANVRKYRFIRDVVFEGQFSPAEVRRNRSIIDPVKPVVTSLGDRKDDWYSIVRVNGRQFMGPFDGGYNRVRYRGHRARHLPITRTRITSWVPRISPGSASVTVTTQDGTSNGKSFRVEKRPWWKFW